jgi:hypothetical protein
VPASGRWWPGRTAADLGFHPGGDHQSELVADLIGRGVPQPAHRGVDHRQIRGQLDAGRLGRNKWTITGDAPTLFEHSFDAHSPRHLWGQIWGQTMNRA